MTLAEEGADFIQVFHYLREHNLSEDESYSITVRIFRGSTGDGKPFTKDLAYMRGFVQTYNFLRLAMSEGRLDSLPLLFCGKIILEDLPIYRLLLEDGVITPPVFVPPHFKDLKGLASWMSFSRFISSLSFDQLQADYGALV